MGGSNAARAVHSQVVRGVPGAVNPGGEQNVSESLMGLLTLMFLAASLLPEH